MPEEVAQDKEGLQIMRVLARNMAWMLRLREAGDKAGVPLPKQEEVRLATNKEVTRLMILKVGLANLLIAGLSGMWIH